MIVFTVLSGLGFGLIVWLGLGAVEVEGWVAAVFCALALGLCVAGLLASVFHLGQPSRALKAFTQWRTSWLSREAVMSVATLATFALFAAAWILPGWRLAWLGALAALLAVGTVISTAMIYAQLRTVPRWRSPLTPALFLLSAVTGGALLAGAAQPSAWLLAALGIVQVGDWLLGDRRIAASGTTLATATGLGDLGTLRLLEPPHTGANYLTREMVHVVGRDHARKLRWIGLGLAVILPLILVTAFPAGHFNVGIAVLAHVAGVLVLRWLFFAQAEHVVGLYYGKR